MLPSTVYSDLPPTTYISAGESANSGAVTCREIGDAKHVPKPSPTLWRIIEWQFTRGFLGGDNGG
jgi:hypothetical protein